MGGSTFHGQKECEKTHKKSWSTVSSKKLAIAVEYLKRELHGFLDAGQKDTQNHGGEKQLPKWGEGGIKIKEGKPERKRGSDKGHPPFGTFAEENLKKEKSTEYRQTRKSAHHWPITWGSEITPGHKKQGGNGNLGASGADRILKPQGPNPRKGEAGETSVEGGPLLQKGLNRRRGTRKYHCGPYFGKSGAPSEKVSERNLEHDYGEQN